MIPLTWPCPCGHRNGTFRDECAECGAPSPTTNTEENHQR